MLRHWHFGPDVPEPNIPYRMFRAFFHVTFSAFWNLEVFHRCYEPAYGSALYICNHQSFLDPPLMSLALRRPMNYMARDSLFSNPLFGPLIRCVNAFPVKRGHADTGALKEALRRLKAGGQVVVFPEGTRTRDGRIGTFLPGVSLLAQRAAQWVVPVVIDGAYECWPRTQPLPLPGRIVVQYAPPMPREQIQSMGGEELLAHVRQTMIDMQADIRRRLGRPAIKY
jgi:1-acyl-sn-glycerol-3-phosphate acyltransferase